MSFHAPVFVKFHVADLQSKIKINFCDLFPKKLYSSFLILVHSSILVFIFHVASATCKRHVTSQGRTMITSEELSATGQSLAKNHSQTALLIAAMNMTCGFLLHRTASDSLLVDLQQALDDCVGARLRELGLNHADLFAAEQDVRRASAVLDYLDALPS